MNPVWKYKTQHKTFIFFNQSFDKKRLKAFITWILKNSGEEEALKTIEILKEIGFHYATKAGISIGLNDLTTPFLKPSLVSKAQLTMNVTDQDFSGARITVTERSQRIIDTWHRASESLKKQVVDHFSTYDPFNPVYIMALSGARGNFSQVRQLIGMRGLMADQQGKIVNFPIRSNLREGLTLTEYFISCSGARKGLVDTALRTADTGYLTRRLVDVSHHIIVKKVRCNTHRGIAVKALQSYNKTLLTLKDRLIGRVLAEDVVQKDENLRLAKRDQEISPKLALQISLVRQKVYIRSPLTCTFTDSVCQLCYGWSMSQGNLVPLGEAVGVIAAQSIGEPGTQLTMRTFHTGGVFSGDLLQEIRAPYAGKISFSRAFQGLLIRTTQGRIAFLTKTDGEIIVSSFVQETSRAKLRSNDLHDQAFAKRRAHSYRPTTSKRSFAVPFQALTMLFVRQGESVEKNQLLAEFAIVTQEGNQPIKNKQTLFAELSGKVIEDRGGTYKAKLARQRGQSKLCPGLASARTMNKFKEIVHLPTKRSFVGQSKQEKLEEPEDDLFKFIEPTKSGRLGFFRILAMRMGATFSYFHPLTPYYQKRLATISRLCFSPKLRFVCLLLGLPLPLGATSLLSSIPGNAPLQLSSCWLPNEVGTERSKASLVPPAPCVPGCQSTRSKPEPWCKTKFCRCGATPPHSPCEADLPCLGYKKARHVPFCLLGGAGYAQTARALCRHGKLESRALSSANGARHYSPSYKKYTHPEVFQNNRLALQTIAEQGDLVDENYFRF